MATFPLMQGLGGRALGHVLPHPILGGLTLQTGFLSFRARGTPFLGPVLEGGLSRWMCGASC